MRTFLALAVFGLTAAAADPKAPPAKLPPVRELDVSRLKLGETAAKVPTDTQFRTARDLAKWADNKAWMDARGSQVNFDTEQVVLFEWHGSTFDNISAEADASGTVVFTYTITPSDTSASKFKAFVIPAKADYKIVTVRN